MIKKIKYSGKNKLKHLISMDICNHSEGIYSQEELITKGKMWLIPDNAQKPADARFKKEKTNE